MIPPPRRIGTPPHDIDINGYFMPCLDRQPILMSLDGTTDIFIPVFSSENKLRELMRISQSAFEGIVRITDPREFINSIQEARRHGEQIRVMVDPYITPEQKTRFSELLLPA